MISPDFGFGMLDQIAFGILCLFGWVLSHLLYYRCDNLVLVYGSFWLYSYINLMSFDIAYSLVRRGQIQIKTSSQTQA